MNVNGGKIDISRKSSILVYDEGLKKRVYGEER